VYSDEERPHKKFEYLYAYNKKPRGEDAFQKTGKKALRSRYSVS
jgi:hypothetical protein